MSTDAENIRRAYEAYATRDVQPLLALIDPECEIQDGPSIPDPEVHHGPAGFLRSQTKFSEVFDDLRLEPIDVVETDRGILVLALARGVERRSDREIEARVAALWTMREGKAVRGVYFDDWDTAQQAAGWRN